MAERLRGLAAQLPQPERAASLIEALATERAGAQDEALAALRSDRYLRLLESLVDATRTPLLLPTAEGPARGVLASVQSQWTSLQARVERSEQPPTDEQLHRIRIHAKRCRYAAEALVPLVGKSARRSASAAADLQTVLGEYHDSVTMRAWLEEQDGGAVAFAAGELAGLELAQAAVTRDSWRKAWKAFAKRKGPIEWT
jgi:CHAD domain-containing protein